MQTKSGSNPVRILLTFLSLAVSVYILWWGFLLLKSLQTNVTNPPNPLILAVFAIIWGVGGMALLFTTANLFVESLPLEWTRRIQPFVFVGPAIALLLWGLATPTLRSFYLSLFEKNTDKVIWFQNYVSVFTDPKIVVVFRNNLMWMIFGTIFTVSLGLLIAVLADKSKYENLAKAIIFLPMAISFVGAGVIWNFIYAVKPVDAPQIGLLNSLVVGLGGQPQAWTAFFQPWNNFFLIVIVIWLQTGYAMVLFSAAIKGIPTEIVEAAKVDGANDFDIFFKMTIPLIMGTIITVSTTIIIFTLKIFDVVMVMTGANYDTSVIATEFYRQYFTYNNNGMGSALAIILFIAVIPVMIYNLRQFGKQEGF